MTTLKFSSEVSSNSCGNRVCIFALATLFLIGFAPSARAQNSSLGIQMVPVTLTLPQLQLTAPLGTTNALEVSTNLIAWQDITTLTFTSTNLLWVDLYPRGGTAYYRLRRVGSGNNPPFPPPNTNLVWMPPGQFVMGSPGTEIDPAAQPEEQEQTAVTLTKGFFIWKYEINQGEYLAVTGSNPSLFTGDTNLPVERVRWTDATNFCQLLNNQGNLPVGYAYRLPTEAEWEYAVRAGSTNRFNWGADNTFALLPNYAWFSDNAGGITAPVGQKQPNSLGLYDTSGNVSEWCLDSYVNFLTGGSVTNPTGPVISSTKVLRGGAYNDPGEVCRAAARRGLPQGTQLEYIGFRIVLAQTAP